MTRKAYHTPHLTEYGRIEQLTLGQSGSHPDFDATTGNLINTICNPALPHPGEICS